MDALIRASVPVKLIAINEDIDDKDMEAIKAFQFYGAYPFSVGRALEYLKNKGKKIVYDVDDALALTDITNPWYYAVKKDLGSVKEILSFADEVTVSTQNIADFIRPQTNAKITIVPNCYAQSEWTFPRPKREGIRIGYAGSSTHVGDLLEILPIIKKLQDKYDFTFIIYGFGASDYKQFCRDLRFVSSPEGQAELERFDFILKDIKFEWVPYVEFNKHPATLTNISLDIGLCPLKDTPFNRGRSACKAMEYTLSGALALASDGIPYNTEPNSTLVVDWEKALTYFIEHPEEIEPARLKNLLWIENNRDIDAPDNIKLLKEIYNEV